jgi:hypothetical protein
MIVLAHFGGHWNQLEQGLPGSNTSIFGYERSASYPNGHRNVFFVKRSDARVTPFYLLETNRFPQLPATAPGDQPGVGTGELVANDTQLLYEDVRHRNAVVISHTSATRMGTDWRDNDPALEPVVEIFQGARTNYEQLGAPHVVEESKDAAHMKVAGYEPAGMVSNAWAKGYKLGIITSSDHTSTHISYAMVYTDDPSRQGILDAIRKRHTYGATDNIILEVRMGSHFMGDEFTLSKAQPIRVKVRGTGKVAKVDIIKDSQVIYSTEPQAQNVELEFTDKGDVNGRHYYYVRVPQADQMLAWSSPLFINYRQLCCAYVNNFDRGRHQHYTCSSTRGDKEVRARVLAVISGTLLLAVFSPTTLWGQGTRGAITGVAKDKTDAVIPKRHRDGNQPGNRVRRHGAVAGQRGLPCTTVVAR